MGWLGYFVGKSDHLEHLLEPFFRKIYSRNRIQWCGPIGGRDVCHCVWGDEGGGRLFSLALGSSTNKSLKEVHLRGRIDMMCPFFKNNYLTKINIEGCGFGNGGSRLHWPLGVLQINLWNRCHSWTIISLMMKWWTSLQH